MRLQVCCSRSDDLIRRMAPRIHIEIRNHCRKTPRQRDFQGKVRREGGRGLQARGWRVQGSPRSGSRWRWRPALWNRHFQLCRTWAQKCRQGSWKVFVSPKPPLPFFLCYLLSFHRAGKAAAQNHQKRSSCRHSSFSLLYRSSGAEGNGARFISSNAHSLTLQQTFGIEPLWGLGSIWQL